MSQSSPPDSGAQGTSAEDGQAFRSEPAVHAILEALPEAVYTTDGRGRITFFNQAAAELWGVRPEIGKSAFCGSWKLYNPDGTPMPHEACPMALALREGRAIRGLEAVAERPDGARVPFLAFPTPLLDGEGALVGAVNMLVDLSDHAMADERAQRLAAIVESSHDAILTKDLKGTITTWNRGAERLYGYAAQEVIGKSVTMLIPLDRHDEEPRILAAIGRGERIEHYETIRRRKDGSLVEISLSVSPIRDRHGRIVGASKIARDITERRRAEEQQQLLIREMNHRVRNLFALTDSLVRLSARSASSAEDLASAISARLSALARAHELTVPSMSPADPPSETATTLHALTRAIMAPYETDGRQRTVIEGPDVAISGAAVTSFALLLHEIATNAAKYGALSVPEGRVALVSREDGERLALAWTETGGPPVDRRTEAEGFGTFLVRATVQGQLGGEFAREWQPEGLSIRLVVSRDRLAG
jgi:PAS domain S-box-containing protein